MATARWAKSFDWDRLRKLSQLISSPNGNESKSAINMALKQCLEYDPPKLFHEAVCEAFGSGSNADLEKLEEEFDQLKTVASRLNEENSRLLQEVDRLRHTKAASEWPPAWFVQPKPLLFALGIAVAMEWSLLLPFWEFPEPDAFLLVQWAHTICAALFLLWSIAVFKCEGSKRLALGWLTWGGAWFFLVAITALYGGGFQKNAFRIGVITAPLHWWSAVGFGSAANHVASALIVLAAVIDIICGANVIFWLRDRLSQLWRLSRELSVILYGALKDMLVDE